MYSCLTSSLKTFALFSTASQNNRNNSCESLAQIYSGSPLKVSAGDTEMERARSRKPNHLWVPPLFWGLGMTRSRTQWPKETSHFAFGVVDSELEWAFHAPTSQLGCTPLGQSLHSFATFFGTHPPWSRFFLSPGAILTLYLDSMLDSLENDTMELKDCSTFRGDTHPPGVRQ